MSSILEGGKYTIRSSTRPRSDQDSAFDSDDADEDFQLVSKTQMYDFAYPMAGMFLWMRIIFSTHPLFGQVDHQRLAKALWVYLTTKPYRVLVAPGSIFSPTEQLRDEKGWQYFRLCFAAVDDDVLEKHSTGLVEGIKSFWTKKRESDIDHILNDEDITVAMKNGLDQCWGGPC